MLISAISLWCLLGVVTIHERTGLLENSTAEIMSEAARIGNIIVASKLNQVKSYSCVFNSVFVFFMILLAIVLFIVYSYINSRKIKKTDGEKRLPRETIERAYRSAMFEHRLKRTNAHGRRRFHWVDIVTPISYAPWKRHHKLHYSLMMRIRGRSRHRPKQIDTTVVVENEAISFEQRLDRFCCETDFLAMHGLTSLFPESSKVQRAYEKAAKGLRDLWPVSSAGKSCFLTSDDNSFLHPGCIFFSRTARQDTPIVIDTGASTSVSPHKEDFIDFKESHSTVTGIGSKGVVKGHGTVRWSIFDSEDKETVVETEAIYMPAATVRLYSPQAHFRKCQKGSMFVDCRGIKILFPHSRSSFVFPFHEPSSLPLMLHSESRRNNHGLYTHSNLLEPHCYALEDVFACRSSDTGQDLDIAPSGSFNGRDILSKVVDERNINLTGPQHELLAWHYRLGHVSMWSLRKLMQPKDEGGDNDRKTNSEDISRVPVIRSNFKGTRSCIVPQCASCNLAKASRTSIRTASTPSSTDGSLKLENLRPGDCISMDQIVCPQKGRTVRSGKRTITGGTIFIDHASGYVKFEAQSSATADATLVGKHALEREAHSLGFRIRSFLTDNGVFKAQNFLADVRQKNQTIQFCGVGAKHQNGIAENHIGTISRLARSMMIHSALRWPDAHDISLWPLCLQHAVYIWNQLPGSDGLSPEEKWTSVKSDHRKLRQLHPWGCPAYVLHPTLQDGKKLPKWKPRSRQGQFVGYSPVHASSVALVLNRTTRRISPQFHLLFDDFGTTVKGVEATSAPNLDVFDWDTFIARHGISTYYDEDDPIPPDTWEFQDQPQREKERHLDKSSASTWLDDGAQDVSREPDPGATAVEPVLVAEDRSAPEGDDTDLSSAPDLSAENQTLDDDSANTTDSQSDASTGQSNRRSGRPAVPNRRYFNEDFVNVCGTSGFFTMGEAQDRLKIKTTEGRQDKHFINSLTWGKNVSELAELCGTQHDKTLIREMAYLEDESLGILNDLSPMAFAARANAGDTPRWNDALHGPNADGFWRAMLAELTTLSKLGAWEVVRRTPDMEVLPSTWAFRIKRFPTGLVRKLKARICVMGNRQIDVDPFECYAPVVAWSTVRTMLILSVILNLQTVQVDYTSAFCQAPVKEDVYVSLPRGWKTLNQMGLQAGFEEDCVMKLKRSLYGLKQSPKNFYDHLKERLESIGFEQSKCDPCLFLKGDVTCLVYVDDCLFFSSTKDLLDETIQDLKDADMELNREDDVAGFLGVLLKRNEDGTVTLSQTGLIKRIVDALGLASANGTKTPAQKAALPRDQDGEEYAETFNYASVVGMMMYLACNSRPDIAFAVHQCARHTHRPTGLHAKYLKQIGRYLQGTKDKGMTISPSRGGELHLECYADADFAGLWGQEDVHDSHCVRSRTGYIIMINKCPILWKSQLQTEIAMSTMEAEYVALSAACRDVIPLVRLTSELGTRYGLGEGGTPVLRTTIYEDNEGALKLANTELPRMTARSKHYGIKYHWFREHVQSGLVEVKPVSTKDQLADIFTKGLPLETFENLRRRLIGW